MDEKERFRNSAKIHGLGVYERTLQAARADLRALLEKRQAIDRRTKELQRFMNTLLAVCEEDAVELPSDLVLPFDGDVPLSLSLIDALRAVLKQRRDFMTVADARRDPDPPSDLSNPETSCAEFADMRFLFQIHVTPLGHLWTTNRPLTLAGRPANEPTVLFSPQRMAGSLLLLGSLHCTIVGEAKAKIQERLTPDLLRRVQRLKQGAHRASNSARPRSVPVSWPFCIIP
jgi:hypothetical protein